MPEPVAVAGELLGKARQRFPPGGSVDGTPSFELFEHGPLQAAIELFGRRFDEAPTVEAGVDSLRWVSTMSALFGPMVFFALRTIDHIEIVDYVEDEGYWDLDDDPPY